MSTNAPSTKSVRPAWLWRSVLAATSLAVVGSIIAVPGTAWAVPVPWRNCGAAGDAVSIQQLDASVWPPQTGKPLTVNVKWVLGEALAKGSFEDVTTTAATGRVREHTVRFRSPVEALFDSFVLQQPAPDLRPPIPAGPYNQSFTFKVQAGGPVVAGQQVGVDMTGYDAAGRRVVCMQLTIPIK